MSMTHSAQRAGTSFSIEGGTGKPLEGIKIVEVAMWAFVPACGGMLSDLGADVIKVEPPTGDPLRGLSIGAFGGGGRVDLSWESYNRGKRSITLDLKQQDGRDVLSKLLEDADVFLTNLLPPARKSMGIDAVSIRARFPDIIYASGSGTGPKGPDSAKGGYDAITFWARGGVSASLTEDDAEYPVGPPGPAFGDTLSGSILAGAICAAIAKRALTGEASVVDVSLLGTAMWSMQRFIAQSTMDNRQRFPRPHAPKPLFASKTLAEWRAILSRQDGQWDVVQNVGELRHDVQVQANNLLQTVDYGDGTTIPLVAVPMLFDGEAMPARRSPDLGADSDAILESLGYDEDAIINLKVKGVVF